MLKLSVMLISINCFKPLKSLDRAFCSNHTIMGWSANENNQQNYKVANLFISVKIFIKHLYIKHLYINHLYTIRLLI